MSPSYEVVAVVHGVKKCIFSTSIDDFPNDEKFCKNGKIKIKIVIIKTKHSLGFNF
jgi:hypothetical protein